jgi:hypothetical protein
VSADPQPDPPVVTVTGGATPPEVAAIVSALAALRADGAERAAGSHARRSLWNARARAARARLSPGPGAWRGSALPR